MRVLTYLEAITEGLREEMRRDQRVFLLGEDIGAFGGAFKVTKGLFEEFGAERVMDTPLAESAIIGVAMGAAIMGMRPVVEIQFADFITCGFNMVVNNAAKAYWRWGAMVPMVIRCPSGGGVHAGPFHSQNPEAWFCHVPGLKVVAPSTPYDAKGLIKAAIRDNNPVLYFENKFLYRRIKGEVAEDGIVVPIGQGEVKRPGKDLSVITYSAMVHEALEAAQLLEQDDIDIEVVDLRSLVPLDKDLILQSVEKTSRALIVHEAVHTAGLGGEVAAIIAEEAFQHLDAPVRRLTAPDTPVPFSPPLEEFFRPNAQKIASAVRELMAY